DRGAVGRALDAGYLDLQPKQRDAGGYAVGPLLARGEIVVDAADQIIGDAAELGLVDPVDEVGEPALVALALLRFLERSPVQGDADRAVGVLDLQHRAVVADLRNVLARIVFDQDILGVVRRAGGRLI